MSQSQRPAGFWIRFLALLIDAVIFSILKYAIGFLLIALGFVQSMTDEQQELIQKIAKESNDPAQVLGATIQTAVSNGAILDMGIGVVISVFIVAFFISRKGGTPGKLALGLRVEMANDGTNVPVWRALLRECVGKSVFWPLTLGIGALALAFNQRKRGIHDVVGGTVVVKVQDY